MNVLPIVFVLFSSFDVFYLQICFILPLVHFITNYLFSLSVSASQPAGMDGHEENKDDDDKDDGESSDDSEDGDGE